MKSKSSWLIAAALVAGVVLAMTLERGKAQNSPPYLTGCEPVDVNNVEGFVTNPGTGIIRIDGLVQFNFTIANSMSRQSVQVQGSALVPPGRTVSVARARLLWNLLPNEVCQLDVSGAVR